ncbi:MAG: hypothetical protein Q8P08_02835, partial [bacterium]|nr:hypothetical protein [bacterium]
MNDLSPEAGLKELLSLNQMRLLDSKMTQEGKTFLEAVKDALANPAALKFSHDSVVKNFGHAVKQIAERLARGEDLTKVDNREGLTEVEAKRSAARESLARSLGFDISPDSPTRAVHEKMLDSLIDIAKSAIKDGKVDSDKLTSLKAEAEKTIENITLDSESAAPGSGSISEYLHLKVSRSTEALRNLSKIATALNPLQGKPASKVGMRDLMEALADFLKPLEGLTGEARTQALRQNQRILEQALELMDFKEYYGERVLLLAKTFADPKVLDSFGDGKELNIVQAYESIIRVAGLKVDAMKPGNLQKLEAEKTELENNLGDLKGQLDKLKEKERDENEKLTELEKSLKERGVNSKEIKKTIQKGQAAIREGTGKSISEMKSKLEVAQKKLSEKAAE